MAQKITEKNDRATIDEWYAEARQMAPGGLAEFIRHLSEDYEHDYGTIIHAIAAGAVATCWAMDKTKWGGLSGFQGSAVMWEFIQHWGMKEPPLMLVEGAEVEVCKKALGRTDD